MGIELDHLSLAELTSASRASAMGTMAATLAHELNQPLTVISNYTAVCGLLISRDPQENADLKIAVAGIRDGVHRMARIICSLRNMSEERAPTLEVFDIKDAIRESVELVLAGTGCDVPIDDGDALSVQLVADRIQIEQVIMNLLRNACEAVSPVVGQVSVSACVKGQDAIVSVWDNGSGVSAKAAATLFERGNSIKLEGMGIGLSICRTIIEEHGGKIWLGSSSSSGANFCFSVPIAPQI